MSSNRYVPRLSKSRYMAGKQCHLRLWNECFARELATPIDEAQQAIFDTGHEVGELAMGRYPGGVMIAEGPRELAAARERTSAVMAGDAPAIFEAAFEHQGVTCRVDVLVRAPNGEWDLVEVKSTGSAKDVHVEDLAVQAWIVRGAEVKVRSAGILTLNTKYVYKGGELDLGALFKIHDRTDEVAELAEPLSLELLEQKAVLAGERAPEVAPSPHCHKPYPCKFHDHCWENVRVPLHPLTDLPGMRGENIAKWEEQGIVDILDLPEEADLKHLQERARQCVRTGHNYRGPGLAAALAEPSFPIHHLDFESFMPVIPRYPGTRPFHALPVQWSNHIEHEDGSLEHRQFLWTKQEDPRPACARSLLDAVGEVGTIVIYSPYEVRMVKELMEVVPEHRAALMRLLPRMWDLHPIIKEHFYHCAFRGSFSIKSVLPALVPEMSYEGLDIADGRTAQLEYRRMIDAEDAVERERIRKALLSYCEQDTLAMLKLREALAREVAG